MSKELGTDTFEIWVSVDGYTATLVPDNSPEYDLLTTDLDGVRMRKVRTFKAETWDEARAVFEDFNA